jgi:hypothetical protein
VTNRFKDILTIYFAFFVTETVRYTLMVLGVLCADILENLLLTFIGALLSVNDFLWLAALIIVHVYRFQESGKFCAGDNYRQQGYSESELTNIANSAVVGS